MKRQHLSTLKKVKIFETAGGRCHICGQRIQVGQKWEVEHRIPLAMGGADDESNFSPAHVSCHAKKTAVDLGQIAKVKRVRAKHLGARKRSTFPKMPEGYRHDWRLGRPVKIV